MSGRKMVRKFLAVASAAVLIVAGVAGDYCTAYAATAAPAIDVEGGLSYLLQMLSSGLGVQVSKASVPALWLAVDAQAKANDPEYMAELRSYCEDNSLISTRELDPSFCNQLLKDLKSIFVSSGDYGAEGADVKEYKVSVPVYGDATYMPEQTSFDFYYANGVNRLTFTVPADCYMLPYASVVDGRSTFIIGLMSENPFTCSWYSYITNASYEKESVTTQLDGRGLYYYELYRGVSTSGDLDRYLSSISIPYPISRVWYNPLVTTDVSIILDRALTAIQAQALVKTPAITAPISVPADTAAMEENAKAVAAAEDADALYKALAAAGIAIDIGIDVPDETEKPTDADITDDNTGAIGKSLTDILAAITGLADKVAAIPGEVADFFSIDTDAIAEAANNLQETFLKQFGGITQLAGIFKRSYEFGMEVPVFTMPVPDPLKYAYPDTDEIVVLDLRPYTTQLFWARGILTAVIWVLFAKWLLDQFDVKLHVG